MKSQSCAIYARVSSDQQAVSGTIRSQLEALSNRATADSCAVSSECEFIDDGYSGSTLVRPALERLRDAIAAGAIDRLYVHSPDRLARRYAYQILLVEEFRRAGVDIVFLNRNVGETPEDELLLQVQGVVAEYERAKILERSRRGKLHAARRGSANVLTKAPYGYRYVGKHEGGGEARFEVVLEEARAVQQMFEWVGRDRVSLAEACRRLEQKGLMTRSGDLAWDSSTVWGMLKNPAYKGLAAYGKTRKTDMHQKLRQAKGAPEHPRKVRTKVDLDENQWISIPVPILISEELFEAVQEQLRENKVRARASSTGARHLLQGLVVCAKCRYAYCMSTSGTRSTGGSSYSYYRCTGNGQRSIGITCNNKPLPAKVLEMAVWGEVERLLKKPDQIETEYRRRLNQTAGSEETFNKSESQLVRLKNSIARLIDSYQDGLLTKAEFAPRIKQSKKQLAALETDLTKLADAAILDQQLKLLIVQLAEFSTKVDNRLTKSDWTTKRELINMLVKRVEVDRGKVNIVFRVGPAPFVLAPEGAISQHYRDLREPPAL